MTRVLRLLAWLLLLGLTAACTSTAGPTVLPIGSGPGSTPAAPASTPGETLVSPAASNPPLHQVSDPGRVTGTIHGPCHVRGTPPEQLPDPACTPGAFDPKVTAVLLCAPDYTTGPYRPPASGSHGTTRFKYDVAYPAYGLPAGTPAELDHLVNLDLAGANDGANLWPEAGKVPNPKDTTENTLHNWVCGCPLNAYGYVKACRLPADAQGRLESAQQAIAADWITALDVLNVPRPTSSAKTPVAAGRGLSRSNA